MTEIKITVEAPGITDALNNLADALRGRQNSVTAAPDKNIVATSETPVEAPVAPVQATPAPVAPTAPAAPVATAPNPEPAPTPTAVQAPATTTPVKHYTLEDITKAGSSLLDVGKMPDLMNLLAEHGVQAITQLKPDQFDAVALGLKALGADI